MDDQRFSRFEEKLDRITEAQAEIRLDLREHMRRTEIAEVNISNLSEAIRPIQEHVAVIRGLAKLGGILLSIAGAIVGFLKLHK